MLGHFAACPANAVGVGSFIVPFSCGHGIMQCSPSLCIVRCSFSPASGRLSTLTPRPSSSGPPLLSFISPSAAHAGSTPCFRPYLHSMHRLCIPSPPHPPSMCYFPPPFAYISHPWSLLFFFILIPLAFTVELRNLGDVVKLGSSV